MEIAVLGYPGDGATPISVPSIVAVTRNALLLYHREDVALAALLSTNDPRLETIHAKVMAGERLHGNDALTLYRTGNLAVGWMAHHVRERLHGDKTYFNVNRHINPTNVCVAACRLCAFGRKKDTPGAYTMALEEAFETAASGYSEAVPNSTSSADSIPICHFSIF